MKKIAYFFGGVLLLCLPVGCAHSSLDVLASNQKILFLCPEIESSATSMITREELCVLFGAAVGRAQSEFAGRGRFRNFELQYAGPGSPQEKLYKQYYEQRAEVLNRVARAEGAEGIVFAFIASAGTAKAISCALYVYHRKSGLSFQPFAKDVPYDSSLLRDEAFWMGMINAALDQYTEQRP